MSEQQNTGSEQATQAAHDKATELGVNVDDVQGTGQQGKVTKGDVERAAVDLENVRKVRNNRQGGEQVIVLGYTDDGEERRAVYPSGVLVPVTQEEYDALPKDPDGNLAGDFEEVTE